MPSDRTRRIFRGVIWAVLLAASSVARGQSGRPLVGAIRWDAWTGGPITEQVERTLGPRKYHDRLPWFAQVIDDQTVRIDGAQPGVLGREIDFAARAGLDYWAFVLYPESSPMSVGLGQYLSDPGRDRLHFCVILHATLSVSHEAWPRELARAVALLREPGYQTVLEGRPLVYMFTGGGGEFPQARFAEFLAAAKDVGLNPYCVYMGWNPPADHERYSPMGFDAVSAYAKASDAPNYSDLVDAAEADWRRAADTDTPYVPLVTTGWDKWPRKDHPVSWELGQPYHQQEVFPSRATPPQIADHLGRALSFVRQHPRICPANTVIVYAWNEYDEGGWIAPTPDADGLPDTSRLDAIGHGLTVNLFPGGSTKPSDDRP